MLKVSEAELPFLQNILADQTNVDEKLVYGDWLQSRGDERGKFLNEYVSALKTMEPKKFPQAKGVDETWRDLVGFTAMSLLAQWEKAPEYRDHLLSLLEPAIRIDTKNAKDSEIEVSVSKYGGDPDLPKGVAWPQGNDCSATYNDDTKGIEQLAGFLMQMNLAEAQSSLLVDLPLPKTGLLSFFCFHDDDNVDCIGVNCFHYLENTTLERTAPPEELSEENAKKNPKRVFFRECLRLPPGFRTDDRDLRDWIWSGGDSITDGENQTLFSFRDYQTDESHFIGINKNEYTTVFIDVSPDISQVHLSWVEFDGDTGFK